MSHFIQIDNFGAAAKAVRALYDSGCRKITMMAHNKISSELAERGRGFAETVKALMPGREPAVVESGFWPSDTDAAAKCLFDLYPETDGVFAATDMCAISVAREGKLIRYLDEKALGNTLEGLLKSESSFVLPWNRKRKGAEG